LFKVRDNVPTATPKLGIRVFRKRILAFRKYVFVAASENFNKYSNFSIFIP